MPTRLSLLSLGHQCWISVRTFNSLFTDSWNLPAYVITLSPVSRHTGLRRFARLNVQARTPDISRSVSLLLKGTGILTCFPFGVLRLRYVLGPTDPRLTNIAEEPWPLRRSGFSPDFAATATRIFVSTRSTPAHADASAHAERLPTRSPCGAPWYR